MATRNDYDVNDTDMLAAAAPGHDAAPWDDLAPLPLVVGSEAASSSSSSSSNQRHHLRPTAATHHRDEVPPPNLAEEGPPRRKELDDVERMICHEDFAALLSKATSVKVMRDAMAAASNTTKSAPPIVETSSLMDASQVIAAVTRMKYAHSKRGQDLPVVRRGMYPITDSMIEESFEVLLKETERCEQWFADRKTRDGSAMLGSTRRKGDGGESIAVKYAKWQTDILMDWMIQHKDHPFPDSDEIKELGERTGLTQSQVVNWTTNVRKRNLKATVEGGKKPHHFVDFVFLAHDRERREAQGLAPAPPPPKRVPRRKKQKHVKAQAPAPTVMAAPPYAVPRQQHSHRGHPGYHHHRQQQQQHYGAPPNGYHHPYYQQQNRNGSYHVHSLYQHPFPPPPYAGYHPSTTTATTHHSSAGGHEEDWERKVTVVSESFDDDATNPVMSAQDENPDALSTFADFWHGGNAAAVGQVKPERQLSAEELNQDATKTMIKQTDVMAAARLENDLMVQGLEATSGSHNHHAQVGSEAAYRSQAHPAGRTSDEHDPPTTPANVEPSGANKRERDSLSSMEMIDLDANNSFLDEYMNSTEV